MARAETALGIDRNFDKVTGVRPPLPVGREAMKILEALFVSRTGLQGMENIDSILFLLSSGKHVILVANHLSHLDGAAIDLGLRWNGFPELAEKLVYLSGLRMGKQFFTRILGKCVPTIPVWPPTEAPRNDEEMRERSRMTRDSLRTVKTVLGNGGIPVVFPEGTRSRTGALRQGIAAVSGFLNLAPDTFVAPVGIIGTDRILPVGSGRPVRGPIQENFGTPFNAATLTGSKQEQIDSVMFVIADLLPDSYKGVYKR